MGNYIGMTLVGIVSGSTGDNTGTLSDTPGPSTIARLQNQIEVLEGEHSFELSDIDNDFYTPSLLIQKRKDCEQEISNYYDLFLKNYRIYQKYKECDPRKRKWSCF